MAPQLDIPTSSDGLMELLGDPEKVKQYFGKAAVLNGDTKRFMDAFGKDYVKRNTDTVDETRAQVQSILFDVIRDAGGKTDRYGPKIGANLYAGKPTMTVDGSPAVSRGRGAVYNKATMGAALEEHWRRNKGDALNSIGEYCQAIKEIARPSSQPGRAEMVAKLSRIQEFQNSFGSEEGGSGGFLIPEIMRSEMLQLALEESIVRNRATVIPMSTLSVPIPIVDETSHVSTIFGGVQFYWAEESSSITESTATFGKVTLTAKKLTGFFKVPNELLNDAPAFSAWFDTRIPAGLAWFEDVAFMTETGVGTPLGFVNCPASVQVNKGVGQDAGTITWENITDMYARMLPTSLKNAIWLASIDTFPQLARMALSVGTGGGPVWIGGYGNSGGSERPPMTILGCPVIFTEKTPALGTTGDINFVDLSYYLIGDRQQVRVDSSDQYLFQTDQMAYRIIERVDGRPWLQSALTPHNNSANTLTAFVQLQSR